VIYQTRTKHTSKLQLINDAQLAYKDVSCVLICAWTTTCTWLVSVA